MSLEVRSRLKSDRQFEYNENALSTSLRLPILRDFTSKIVQSITTVISVKSTHLIYDKKKNEVVFLFSLQCR